MLPPIPTSFASSIDFEHLRPGGASGTKTSNR